MRTHLNGTDINLPFKSSLFGRSVYLCQDLSSLLFAQHEVLHAAQWSDAAIGLQHVLLLQNTGGEKS